MGGEDMKSEAALDANWHPYPVKEPLPVEEVSQKSLHVKMRDGVRIAVTYYLPKEMPKGQKRPAILRATRYWRAWDTVPPDGRIRLFLANGYAFVSVDARGTGASFGCWSGARSTDEARDYGEVVNWIIQQPWSDGSVGTAGGSYEGITAEMTVTNCNPAVKAAMPLCAPFDGLRDINAPGGIALVSFTEAWINHVAALDRNEPRTIPAGENKTRQVYVLPVDEDHDGSLLKEAVSEHVRCWESKKEAYAAHPPDEDFWDSNMQGDDDPYGFIEQLRRSQTPIYSQSGYGDGGDALGAIHCFLSARNPGSKLVLGRWGHGSTFHIIPYVQSDSAFNLTQEEIRFFDHHLKGIDNGIKDEPPVHYYTMIEEKWHSSDTFPPPTAESRLYFQTDHGLDKRTPQEKQAWDEYQVDYTATTGESSRWNTLRDASNVSYPDRREADRKLLCYDSSALSEDLIITGMPFVSLHISSSATDGDFFAYLEDVGEDGTVTYVTEGQLRALHRKLSTETPPYHFTVPYHSFRRKDGAPLVPAEIAELVFHLHPVSYMFRKGHRIRLALAGADIDHFRKPNMQPPLVRYYRQADHASCISLPVEKGQI